MSALATVALTWAALSAGLGAVAVIYRWRQRRSSRTAERPRSGRPLLLIRPCAGDEPTLEHCLASVAESRTDAAIDVVIGVSTADDEALPAARRARDRLVARGFRADVEVHPPRGPNHKAAILAGVIEARAGRYDVVCNADSNVDLSGFDMAWLAGPLLEDPGLGAVWVPAAEEAHAGGLAGRASVAVLNGSLHAFALLAGIDPQGLVGKLFSVRATALEAAGGFGALTHHLGEDFELSRRLHRAGLGVRPAPSPVRAISHQRHTSDVVARHARWMAVVRAQRPWLLVTYPLFFFSTPFVVVLAALGATEAPAVAAGSVLLSVSGRLLVAVAARHFSERPTGPAAALVDATLADLVLLAAFVRALSTNRLSWRGRKLRLDRAGRLHPD